MDDHNLRALRRTLVRFQAMRDDYVRKEKGISTMLVVDACDLLSYMHIVKERGLTLQERAASGLFDDETHGRVLLAPHAYELLSYIFHVLLAVEGFRSGGSPLRTYTVGTSTVEEFMTAFEKGDHARAVELWADSGWAGLVKIARDGGQGVVNMVLDPLRILYRLIEDRKIVPVDQIGLPATDVHGSFSRDDVVDRVLHEFREMPKRRRKDINNLVDARTLGITLGLNEHSAATKVFFTVTTLSAASLTAYSRSLPDIKAAVCRNTFVSAYRHNLQRLDEGKRDPLGYMRRGTDKLESVIDGYSSFMQAAEGAKARKRLKGEDIPRTLRYMADFLEYYEAYYRKLIEPVISVRAPDDSEHEIAGAYRILSDERQFQESMRAAHQAIHVEAEELAARVHPFVAGTDGSHAEQIKIGDLSIGEKFNEIVTHLKEQGGL